MGKVIDTTGQTVREGQSSKFLPLKAGEYTVSVYDAEEFQYKQDSAGQGRDGYRLQLRIADGQEGANRRLFESVPLFLEWGPTEKNPDGSDAFTFYDFFAAIKGVKSKDFRSEVKEIIEAGKELKIPTPKELLGKKLNVVLKIVPDTYAFKKAKSEGTLEEGETQQDYLTNTVSAWKPYAEVAQASASAKEEDAFVL